MSVKINPTPFPQHALPEPIFEADPGLVTLYWEAWRSAWNHVVHCDGVPQSPYMDEAFADDTIWIWDTCFMALFCKYGASVFPGIESLDNFYQPIHEGHSSNLKIQHPDNPPLFAWVELENARFTGDRERLRRVFQARYLQKHYDFFHHQPPPRTVTPAFARYHNDLHWTGSGYCWSGVASGMDNTPRGRGTPPHGYDGHERILWLDALAQQGLALRCMAEIADLLGDSSEAARQRAEHARLREMMNRLYWDEEDGIFYDLLAADPQTRVKVKTPAAYWPLLADFCDAEQVKALAAHAADPRCFGGVAPWPSVSREDPDYSAKGFYWRGGIWLPLAYMATKALERHGYTSLADDLATRLVRHQLHTYTGFHPATIWECYAPEAACPSTEKDDERLVRPDFCGWSALGPIALFIENILGFRRVDVLAGVVEWECHQPGLLGLNNLRFGDIHADFIREENGHVTVQTNGAFKLIYNGTPHTITPGRYTF